MDAKTKKTLLATLGSILIGLSVIWGAIGFKIKNAPYLLILFAAGCICSYLSKKMTA